MTTLRVVTAHAGVHFAAQSTSAHHLLPRARVAAGHVTPVPRRQRLAPLAAAAADGFAHRTGTSAGGLPAPLLSWIQATAKFMESQYLPIALVSALLLGASYPAVGLEAAKLQVPAVATFGIFIVQGLQLRRREAAAALTMRREIAYGLLAILAITPLLGLLVAQVRGRGAGECPSAPDFSTMAVVRAERAQQLQGAGEG
jgi:hypothetical protein